MIPYYTFDNIGGAWDTLVARTVDCGEEYSPRGMKTLELQNVAYEYEGPYQYTFNNPIRKANPIYHIVELFYYLNGRDDGLRGEYINNVENYSNPLTNRHDGSYGRAFYEGLPRVIMQLQKDRDTRRAVIGVINTNHILNPESKDVPCNDLFGWRIRDDRLDMNVVTRSQDLYIGWIYNTLGFQLLHMMLAKALDLEVGTYGHYIFSLHLYEKDVEKAKSSIGKTELDTHKPELVDYSPKKMFSNIRLINTMLEFPAYFGKGYNDFEEDIYQAIRLYKKLDNPKDIKSLGLYTSWVINCLSE